MGGSGAISNAVEASIRNLSIEVERIYGSNRYGTAVNAATHLRTLNAQSTTAVLASGLDFPDALSAGSFAARTGYPILLTNSLQLSETTENYIDQSGIKNIIIIGQTQPVSANVEQELKNKGISVTRIGGTNRADTSRLIAEKYFKDSTYAVAASGYSFADGLTAAPMAAKLNAPVLLVSDSSVSYRITDHLRNSSVRRIKVIGGDAVIVPAVRDQLFEAIIQ